MIVGVAATGAAAVAAVLLGERWWPLAFGGLLPLAACWLLLAALGAGRCLPLAGSPRADPVGWLARAGMLPMLVGWPAMAAWCSASGLSPAALVALHAVPMLLPLLSPRPWPRALVALAMALSALPMLLRPGAEAWMAASALQALACGLAMQPRPVAAPAPAGLACALATLALGLLLAEGGAPALMQLQLGLALAVPAACLLGRLGPVPSRDAAPRG